MRTALFCCVSAFAAIGLPAIADDEPTSRQPLAAERKSGQTDRVMVVLEVGGETKYTEEDKPQQEKMGVTCKLDYLEKSLGESAGVQRSARDYQKVDAKVTVGDGRFEPTLRPEHRLIAVEVAKQSALLFSPHGNLTRDELEVIDVQVNSLLLDRLLPEKPVAVGDSWPHSPELLAAMLGLDEVAKSTVRSTLKEIKKEPTRTVARFEFSGRVEGAIFGVSTAIELKGRYRFDVDRKRIDWLGLLVKENRKSSFVDDGVDAVSRLQIIVTPAKESASLADAALEELPLKSTPEMTYLTYELPAGDWQCQYDRRWYIHHQRPKSPAAVLRLLDRGTLAGQCNLASLPQREPDKIVSLAEFQDDVQRALGKSFGEFVEAGQSANASNYRVYRVVVDGTSSDIPMRWIYYLVADPKGRQAAFTFTLEQSGVERFAEADKPLIQSLRFVK
jgi:hypothetical protein